MAKKYTNKTAVVTGLITLVLGFLVGGKLMRGLCDLGLQRNALPEGRRRYPG